MERQATSLTDNVMEKPTLEQRIVLLESQVAELREELQRLKNYGGKDWRRTIGAFIDDEGMQEILREAMRLRESDRANARLSEKE